MRVPRNVAAKRITVLALAIVLVTTLVVRVAACGDDGGDATTSSGATGAEGTADTGAGATTTLGNSAVTGKTAADYEATLPDLIEKAEATPTDLAVLQQLAIAQYQTQRYEEAAATYASMLEVEESAMIHNNLANVLRDWGKTDEARAEYETALSINPGLSIAYMNLASLSLRDGDTAGALEILATGIAKATGADRQRLEELKATIESQPES